MNRFIWLLLLLPVGLVAQTVPDRAIPGWCQSGAVKAQVSGMSSSNTLQGTIPDCTVTVYLTGTTTRATIHSDPNNTSLSNPFTAADSGQWTFWAQPATAYDIVLSGGRPGNTYSQPVTLTAVQVGGPGAGGATSPGGNNQELQFNANNFFQGTTGLTWDAANALLKYPSGTISANALSANTLTGTTVNGGTVTSTGAVAGATLNSTGDTTVGGTLNTSSVAATNGVTAATVNAGTVTSSGPVNGATLNATGNATVGGNLTASGLNATNSVTAGSVTATGAVTAASLTAGVINGPIAPTQVTWPPTCTGGTVYNPSSNSCVAMGSGNNPGGSNLQMQYNNGGFFGGVSGVLYDGSGGISATGNIAATTMTATTVLSSAQPAAAMADIRHPSFAGGAKCNGVYDDTPALQAAFNAIPKGGNFLIPSGTTGGTRCFIAHPELLSYPVQPTIYMSGTTVFGTTWTIPAQGPNLNIIGYNGGSSAQFQAPGQWANMIIGFPSGSAPGNGTGTLGTFDLGAGESVSSFQVTTGAMNNGSNQMTVTDPTSYNVGDWVITSNTATGGYPQLAHITAIAGNVFTLDVTAGSTQPLASGNLLGRIVTFTPSSMGGLVEGPATTGYINGGTNQLHVTNPVFQNGQAVTMPAAYLNQNTVVSVVAGGGTTTLTLSANANLTVPNTAPAAVGMFFINNDMTSGTGADITVIDKLTCDMFSMSRSGNYVTGQTPVTTGSITVGTNILTIASGTFSNGSNVQVTGVTFNSQSTTLVTAGGGTTTLTLSSNASATVTNAAVQERCRVPVGAMITVSGASDPTFNGGGQSANPSTNFRLLSNDYLTGRIVWKQTGAASSATGAIFTGTFEDTVENVSPLFCSATTCTVVFWRPHTSASLWGLDSMALLQNNPGLMKDFAMQSYIGTALRYTGFHATMLNVGVGSQACNGPATNFGMSYETSFTNISGLAVNASCQPWGLRITNPNNAPNGVAGPIYIKDSFIMVGVHGDHGGGAYTSLTNTICDQPTAGCIMIDPSNYWSTGPLTAVIDGSGYNDNPAGFPTCYFYSELPVATGVASGTVSLKNVNPGCLTNEYYLGQLKQEASGGWLVNSVNNTPVGPKGTMMASNMYVGEHRAMGTNMAPAVIPHATLPVITVPANWGLTGGMTVTTVDAPDGTNTAGRLTCTSATAATPYAVSSVPTNGDLIIYGGWARTLSPGLIAGGGGSGASFTLDNEGTTNWQIAPIGIPYGINILGSTSYDANITDDWWHPVVSVAQVVNATGGGGYMRLEMSCDQNHPQGIDYWQPFMIWIRASENIPLREVMRWRTDLLHGLVPPGIAGPGIYSGGAINLPADPTAPAHAVTKNYVDNVTLSKPSPTTLTNDSFQRYINITGANSLGSNWTVFSTAGTGSQMYLNPPGTVGTVFGSSTYYDDALFTGGGTFNTAQCASYTIQQSTLNYNVTFFSLLINGTNSSNWYVAGIGQNTGVALYSISKVVAGTTTQLVANTLFTTGGLIVAGDKFTFCNTGGTTNNLVVYRNNAAGPTAGTATDLSGGFPGFGLQQGYTSNKIGSFFATGLGNSTMTLGGSALSIGCTASANVTVALPYPVTTGMVCTVSGVGGNPANIQPQCAVTALNTITPYLCTAVAGTPASQSYAYRIMP